MTAALIALKEAVERGRDESEKWHPAFADHGYTAMRAFHGSLDAAVSLLGAVLPGWGWECGASTVTRPIAHVWKNGRSRGFPAQSTTPARALLLAILSALIDASQTQPTAVDDSAAAEADGKESGNG